MPLILQSLPYVVWILMATLACGSFAFVVVTRQLTDATRGYLGFTAFCAGLLGLLAFLTGSSLGIAPTDLIVQGSSLVLLQQLASAVFTVAALAYPFAARAERVAQMLG